MLRSIPLFKDLRDSDIALLGDLSILDDQDSIGAANGREAVRDDKRCASLHQGFHAALDEGLGQCIY